VATEYFNKKAEEEKKKSELALKKANETPQVASVATKHFDEKKKQKAEAIEEAREKTRQNMLKQGSSRRPVDWKSVTKQQAPGVDKFYTVSSPSPSVAV